MNRGNVEVVLPGAHTTVQDLGRWGHQASGVPVAGAMDPFAHRLANLLVGNPRDAATLEVTLVGPAIQFEDERVIAVAGATFGLSVDEEPVAPATPVPVRAGSVVRFGPRITGARAYLAVDGGFDVPPVLGSRATHVPSGMGGWQGRALVRGDRLPLGTRPARADGGGRRVPPGAGAPVAPVAGGAVTVRVLPGPQHDRFAEDALSRLVSAPYRVAIQSNRMGYRLEGPGLPHRAGADVLSAATPVGSLQVPGSGQPVLLMADRQTTGGYARLATVISADIPVVAQVAPGEMILFAIATRAAAVAALIARERPLLAREPDRP
jgi:antagonist of KipI